MDRLMWLSSAPWLVLLGSETLHELRKTCQFHPILIDAVCCFQAVGGGDREAAPSRRFLWFAPAASNVDCTQLFLEVSLLLDSSDQSKPAGLVFCIDNATFLVDHTVMGEIDVPNAQQENVEALHGPRYAAISWPTGIQMRLFLPPGTPDAASIQKLSQCVQNMITYLRSEQFRHPVLLSLRKGCALAPFHHGNGNQTSGCGNNLHLHHSATAAAAAAAAAASTPHCPLPLPLPTQSPPLGQYQPSSSSRSRGTGKRARFDNGNGSDVGGEGDPPAIAAETKEHSAQVENEGGDIPPALQEALRDWLQVGPTADRILSPTVSADVVMQAVLIGGSAVPGPGPGSGLGTGPTALATAAAEREAAIRALLSCAPAIGPRRSADYDALLLLQSRLLSSHAAAELEQTLHSRALGVRGDVSRLLDSLYGPAAPGYAAVPSAQGSDGGHSGSSSSAHSSSSTRDGGLGGLDYGADDGLSPAQSGSQNDRGLAAEDVTTGGAGAGAGAGAVAALAAAPSRATSEAERRAAAARISVELATLRHYSHASAVLRALPRHESFFCD